MFSDMWLKPHFPVADFPDDVSFTAVGTHIIVSELLTGSPTKLLNLADLGTKLSHADDTLILSLNQKLGHLIDSWPYYATGIPNQ